MNARLLLAVAITSFVMLLSGCGSPEPQHPGMPAKASQETTARAGLQFKRLGITREDYHGWSSAIAIRNEQAEVIVVPEIGRVMAFGMLGGENVLWDDPSLYGRPVNPDAREWINFGGDKSWPAPEAEWGFYTGRKDWRPPPAFDAAPNDARMDGKDLVLLSPVDPFYGIQVTRRIHLDSRKPKLTITTTYERKSGSPSKIGVWVITQLNDPVAVYVPHPENSRFPVGFFNFNAETWTNVAAAHGLITITRDPLKPHKLGTDADQMLWVGGEVMCLVSSSRAMGGEYPDRGASAEVYTNPDPKRYVELETLGPLSVMKPGDKITRVNTYTLFPRTGQNPAEDARRILKR